MISIITVKVVHGGNYNVAQQRQLEQLPDMVHVFSTDHGGAWRVSDAAGPGCAGVWHRNGHPWPYTLAQWRWPVAPHGAGGPGEVPASAQPCVDVVLVGFSLAQSSVRKIHRHAPTGRQPTLLMVGTRYRTVLEGIVNPCPAQRSRCLTACEPGWPAQGAAVGATCRCVIARCLIARCLIARALLMPALYEGLAPVTSRAAANPSQCWPWQQGPSSLVRSASHENRRTTSQRHGCMFKLGHV
jgi:hypothetical protein